MAFDVFLKTIGTGITQFRVADAIDIIIIAVLLYHLIVFTRETRAIQLVKGLAILLAVAATVVVAIVAIVATVAEVVVIDIFSN